MGKNLKIIIIAIIGIIIASVAIFLLLPKGNNENNDHVHEWKEIIINPTCETDGIKYEECSCKEKRNEETIKALGHNYENGKCINCGQNNPNSEIHVHSIVIDEEKKPTCTNVGLTEGSHCKDCGEIITAQQKVPKLGHDLKDWEVYTQSTEEINGEKRRTCTRCDYYESAKLPLLNHEYQEVEVIPPTCTEYGYTLFACNDCEDTYKDIFIDKIDHDDVITTIEPTCDTDGYNKHQCSMCDRILITDYILAIGHNYGEWETTIPATCSSEGQMSRTCLNCNHQDKQKLEQVVHNYILIEEDVELSKNTYECSLCNDKISIDSNTAITDITNNELNVNQDFTFEIIYNGLDEEYIKENLIIIDSCLKNTEYEQNQDLFIEYTIKKINETTWKIDPIINEDDNGTYIVTLNNDLLFKDYYGNTLYYTYEGNEKQNIEFRDDIIFLKSLENTYGGYYPYSINTNDSTEYIYLTIQRCDHIKISDILFIGNAETKEEILSLEEDYLFGKVSNIYENENEEYIVVLENPRLDEVFKELNIFTEEAINLEQFDIEENQIEEQVLSSFYQSDDFLEFIAASNQTSNDFCKRRNLISTPLTEDTFLYDIKIEDPKITFKYNEITVELNGNYQIPIKTKDGVQLGSFSISFETKAQFKLDLKTTIILKFFEKIPTGFEYVDVSLTQTDYFSFNFNVNFDINFELDETNIDLYKYVYTNSTLKIHTTDCLYVNNMDPVYLTAINTEELLEFAAKDGFTTCTKCKPVEELNASALIINTANKTAHCLNCYHVDDISEENKEYYYGSVLSLIEYNFCKYCTPQIVLARTFEEKLIDNLKTKDWSTDINKIKSIAASAIDNKQNDKKISLGSITFSLSPIITAQLKVNISMKFDLKAHFNYSYEHNNSNTYGIRFEGNKIKTYSKVNHSKDEGILKLTGEIDFKTGIEAMFNISMVGLNKWVNIGMSVESGIGLEFDGIAYLKVNQNELENYLGVYAETYIYAEIEASYKLVLLEGSKTISEEKVPVSIYGCDKAIFSYVNDIDNITITDKEYNLNLDKILEVYYYDIHASKTKTEVLKLNSKLYTITFELINGTYCKYQDGKIIITDDTIEEFTDILKIKVTSNTKWTKYVKGSSSIYLDELEITINYKEKHTHTESEWIEIIEATCEQEGLIQKHCTTCLENISSITVEKLDHNYVDGYCTMCNKKEPEIIGSQGLEFTKYENGYMVSGIGNCKDKDIVIPEVYKDKPVIAIADEAFDMCFDVISVTIPNSVTSIGKSAFECCTKLTSIKIGDSVVSIGELAFVSCFDLTNIIVDENNPNYKSIDGNLYSKDTTVLIQYAVGKLDNTFVIPDGVTKIGDNAFYYCENLTSMEIPDGVKSIGNKAFYCCKNLRNMTISNSVTEIGDNAFYYCQYLWSMIIPNSVVSLGEKVFYNCTFLTNITIGNSLKNIGKDAFTGCGSLKEITVDENNPNFKSIDGNLYSKDETVLIQYAVGKYDTSFIIPDNVTSIRDGAFYCGDNLISIVIPNGVTNIGDYAFCKCDELTNIEIPNSVTNIGSYAFYYCSSLINIEIPNNVTSIGDFAFYGCKWLTNITIPNSVTSIGESAFFNCSTLTYNIYDTAKYLGNSENPYMVLMGPTSYGLISCEVHEDTKFICNSAFDGCNSLISITIPTGVTSIGKSAFYDCSSLMSIEIPSSVTNIGECAFVHCDNLTSITVDENNLNYKSLEGNLYNKDTTVFIHYVKGKSDTSFVIPDSVTMIGDNAFVNCENLTSITIPNSVTIIGNRAFYYCYRLKSIEIPNSVISIGEFVFSDCYNLENVYFNGTLEEFMDISFDKIGSNPMNYADHLFIKDTNGEWIEVTDLLN